MAHQFEVSETRGGDAYIASQTSSEARVDARTTIVEQANNQFESCYRPDMSELQCYVVEDSEVIRENLVATLEEMTPIRVIGFAEDQKTAVAWLQNAASHCDVLIVDIFLKSGSGLEVLKAAQKLQSVGKRVVLTNYATVDMRRRCLELGADKVFDKSSEIEGLISYCIELAKEIDSEDE